MRETTTIERRQETDERAARLLRDSLRGRGGAITKSDAIALTGLSANETDAALRSLMQDYKSHLAVTEQGELLYKFDPAMERRDAVPLRERLEVIGQYLWRGFKFLFKIWIVVTLIVYVLLFVAMMLALIFGGKNDRDNRSSSRSGGGGNFWLVYWLMPDWAPRNQYGYGVQRRRLPQKRFYQSVFDFVFGPEGAPKDPLAAEKQFVAYLREKNGRITTTDLVELTGWTYQRADEEMTRLLVAYDGEPEVQDDGTLIYTFSDLLRSTDENGAVVKWRYTWQESRQPAPFTGNTGGANFAITALNAFNLLGGLVIAPAFLGTPQGQHLLYQWGLDPSTAIFFAESFPLAFSSVFFAVPGMRAIKRTGEKRRLKRATARAMLLREIMARHGEPVQPAVLLDAARSASGMSSPGKLFERELDKLLVELDGDVTTDAAGNMQYTFPRVAAELAAARTARGLAPHSEREVGQVVFASDEEGTGEVPSLPSGRPPKQLH